VLSGTFKSLEIGHSLGSVRWSPLGDLLAVTCDTALGAPVNGLAWAPDSFDRLAAVDYSGSLSILSSKSEQIGRNTMHAPFQGDPGKTIKPVTWKEASNQTASPKRKQAT
jgi:hypothetical protein